MKHVDNFFGVLVGVATGTVIVSMFPGLAKLICLYPFGMAAIHLADWLTYDSQ